TLVLLDQPSFTQLTREDTEEAVRHGKIEQNIAAQIPPLVEIGQTLPELLEGFVFLEIALEEGHVLGDGLPQSVVHAAGASLPAPLEGSLHKIVQAIAPLLGGLVVVIHADDGQVLGQPPCPVQVVERGHDQSLGEIAIGAEDHDGAIGRRRFMACAHLSSSLALWAGVMLSTWPPNSLRMAESSFSPKLCSMRERKRA